MSRRTRLAPARHQRPAITSAAVVHHVGPALDDVHQCATYSEAVELANRLNSAFATFVHGATPDRPGSAPSSRSWATPYTATEWAETRRARR